MEVNAKPLVPENPVENSGFPEEEQVTYATPLQMMWWRFQTAQDGDHRCCDFDFLLFYNDFRRFFLPV